MKKATCFFFLLVLWLLPFHVFAESLVDAIVMSYDRPLQLWATLESLEKYCTGINSVHVILRTSDDSFESGYRTLFKRFPYVIVHHQSRTAPKKDFQPLFFEATFGKNSPSPYVMFLVDDDIATDYIDLHECVLKKEHYQALGFYLKLGKNVIYRYVFNNRESNLPPKGDDAEGRYFIWHFSSGLGCWNFPINLDMTLYKKDEIAPSMKKSTFCNPNDLEESWNINWRKIQKTGKEIGISYKSSKMINLPLNKVGTRKNRIVPGYSAKMLLEKFSQGYRLDISPFFRMKNSSCHVEAYPKFIKYTAQKGAL
jgi:hypothetical protein